MPKSKLNHEEYGEDDLSSEEFDYEQTHMPRSDDDQMQSADDFIEELI